MKHGKRLLVMLLVLLMLLPCTPLAYAKVIAEGTCGMHATWVLETSGTLSIDGSGTMNSYNGANKDFREYDIKIMNLSVGGLVTTVGNYAFQSMRNLRTATIAGTVHTIGQSAFKNCQRLREVTLPETLKTLGKQAFEGCTSLKNIVLPAFAKNLGANLFTGCTSLQTITVLNKNAAFPQSLFAEKTTVIRGYTGSTAQTYAQENGLTFVAIEETNDSQPTTQPTTPTAGNGKCPLCGQTHEGFPDVLMGALHQLIYVLMQLFAR